MLKTRQKPHKIL